MFRLKDLAGRRVGILGYGREGHSALRAIGCLGLTVDVTVMDENEPLEKPAGAKLRVAPLGALQLDRFDVLIKAPGISVYRPEIQAAMARGVAVISSSSLWFAEPRNAPVIAISGSKGKSTTAALIHFLLRCARVNAALAGNIGVPLLNLLSEPPAEVYVVELSSYQTTDFAGRPDVAVLTNLFPEHLDWHGDLETYYRDKLKLFAAHPPVSLINGGDPESLDRTAHLAKRRLFNHPQGWLVSDAGISGPGAAPLKLPGWRLPGVHNLANLAAALAAVDALGKPVAPGIDKLADFAPLPHRLEVVGENAHMTLIDDSISTSPRATVAALEAFHDRAIAVIVGGFDRGLSWQVFIDYLRRRPLGLVMATGASGPRIAAAIRAACPQQTLMQAPAFADAVARALAATPAGGILLLSPGAPSYGEFANFEERGRRFKELALAFAQGCSRD